VRLLAEHGARLDVPVQGTPPIVLAAGEDCADTIRFLVSRGADVNARGEGGLTALMAAARRGLVPIAELLIASGADPEARNDRDQTAWFYAAMSGQQEFVELLRRLRDKR
jgi:ankyrin repeat protein